MTPTDPTSAGGGARRYVVAGVDEVPEGGRIIVEAGGHSIGVFRLGGRFYALLNRCPHAGAELCRGKLMGLVESDRPGEYRFDADRPLLVCPWHGWEFDVTTGQSYFDPRRTRARAYNVDVERGEELPPELTEGPFKAERVPVEVDGEYLVVSMGRFQPVLSG
jgi:nitrite reductase/ring-hydroxylating ferredoxin subunit